MFNKEFLILIVIIFLGLLNVYGQNIPQNPNQIDSQNRKQGKWTLYYNEKDELLNNEKGATYYRIAEYKDNKPIGTTKFYYIKNHQLYFEGQVGDEIDGQIQSLKGLNKWYWDNGNLMRIMEFDNQGNLIKFKEYEQDGKEVPQEIIAAKQNYIQAIQKFNEKKYEEALKIYEDCKKYLNYENFKVDYFYLVYDAGRAAQNIKQFGKAFKYFEEAVLIAEKHFGDNHDSYFDALDKAAEAALLTNNIVRYDFYVDKIKSFVEKKYGKNSQEYIGVMNSAAFSYYYKQDYEKAAKTMVNILPLQEKLTGKNHKDYALLLYNIGTCYYELKKCQEALPYLQEAKKLMENLNMQSSKDYQGAVSKINNCK